MGSWSSSSSGGAASGVSLMGNVFAASRFVTVRWWQGA